MIDEIPQEKFRGPLKELAEKAAEITDAILEMVVYGSVARGEADSRSDIDVFVLLCRPLDADVEDELLGLARSISEKNFYRKGEWNKINLVLCSPKEIRNFDSSTLAAMLGGIRLYSKFEPLVIQPLESAVIFHLDLKGVGETTKKRMDAALRGWTSSYASKKGRVKKEYGGLLERYSSSRLARDVYFVPSDHARVFSEFFSGLGIKFTEMRVWLRPGGKASAKSREHQVV
ncbi:MAG: nucleotidyltransferase domain-containing protein [Candidatus Hodarchaeaceae archaeon]|nr:nucleotidyltransferase domain-containing protein [Candidatus Hodarchaeaceae archaeon]